MRVEFHSKPSYALAICYLNYGESVRAESGAMAAMSDGIGVSADAGPGGVVKGIMRKTVGGESFFMGRYEAHVEGAWVAFAPKYPGDIEQVDLDGSVGICAESGSLLALAQGVDADVRWAGLRSIVLREGATMLHLTGRGTALLCSYGGIIRHELGPGQKMVVDTGHLVAYSDDVKIRIGALAGVITAKASGEGLVAELTGPGTAWVQTRSETEFANWFMPKRAQNSK